jgi:hypothetical protein
VLRVLSSSGLRRVRRGAVRIAPRRRSWISLVVVLLLGCLSTAASSGAQSATQAPWDPARGILIEGATVVTMDDEHTVIPHGRVLVRNERIVAVWQGPLPPEGVAVGDASVVRAGPQDFPRPHQPVSHESAYRQTVEPAGRSGLLSQAYTTAIGHCAFDPAQSVATVSALDTWVGSGAPPTAADFPASLGFDQSFVPPPWLQP